MKTNFKCDSVKAMALACEYSDAPDLLESLLTGERLKLEVNQVGIIPSPWDNGGRKLNCVMYNVTVNGFTFPFYGSHADSEALTIDRSARGGMTKMIKSRNAVRDGVLYSVLCCIRSEAECYEYEPEDLGMNSDSIRDMAKWNEGKAQGRKIRAAIALNESEFNSLPQ